MTADPQADAERLVAAWEKVAADNAKVERVLHSFALLALKLTSALMREKER